MFCQYEHVLHKIKLILLPYEASILFISLPLAVVFFLAESSELWFFLSNNFFLKYRPDGHNVGMESISIIDTFSRSFRTTFPFPLD